MASLLQEVELLGLLAKQTPRVNAPSQPARQPPGSPLLDYYAAPGAYRYPSGPLQLPDGLDDASASAANLHQQWLWTGTLPGGDVSQLHSSEQFNQGWVGFGAVNAATAAAAAAAAAAAGRGRPVSGFQQAAAVPGRPPSAAALAPPQGAAAPGAAPSASSSLAPTTPVREPVKLDFGPSYRPGYLAVPDDSEQVPNLPAVTGTGLHLPPARLSADSCVPPPFLEPFAPNTTVQRYQAVQQDGRRVTEPEQVINRVVYDSLLPPDRPEAEQPEDGVQQVEYWPGQPTWLQLQTCDDSTLVFEGRFESGNLRRAVQVYEFEYDLILQPDINTRAHTQWFFFAVMNMRRNTRYKFNIINLVKPDSLYIGGMQPLMHSQLLHKRTGLGWHRAGTSIAYYANTVKRGPNEHYNTVSFVLEGLQELDTLHLAHCYPYTYTDLQRHLHLLQSDPARQPLVQRERLASTLAGNCCDVLTITEPTSDQQELRRRKGAVISARVHPGETNASWMMRGLLEYLTGPSAEAAALRKAFVFKVVPMLNPDGVINGNYRCSLAGMDLNRVWQEPSPRLHPTIAALKQLLREFSAQRELLLFCDLHGHSCRNDVFMYGCEKKPKEAKPFVADWPVPGSKGVAADIPVRLQERVFPMLLHQAIPDVFSYRRCNFKVQEAKAGTGRVVAFRELGLANAFTLEASFAGASAGRFAGHHFHTGHLEAMGAAVVRTLLDYCRPEAVAAAVAQLSDMLAAQQAETSRDGAGDDACTDSDDTSSSEEEEERGAARQKSSAQVTTSRRASRSEGAADGPAAPAEHRATRGSSSSSSVYYSASSSSSTRHTTQDGAPSWPPDSGPAPDTRAAAEVAAGSSAATLTQQSQQQQQQQLSRSYSRKISAPELLQPSSAAPTGRIVSSRRTHSTGSSPARPHSTKPAQLDTSLAEALLQPATASTSYLPAAATSRAKSAKPDANAAAAVAAAASAAPGGAAARGGKKKKKRRAKSYGNPEVLKAERNKADEGLAACLPLLMARQHMEAISKQQQLQQQEQQDQQQQQQQYPGAKPGAAAGQLVPGRLSQSGSHHRGPLAAVAGGRGRRRSSISTGGMAPLPEAVRASQQEHVTTAEFTDVQLQPTVAQPVRAVKPTYLFDPGQYSNMLRAEKRSWGGVLDAASAVPTVPPLEIPQSSTAAKLAAIATPSPRADRHDDFGSMRTRSARVLQLDELPYHVMTSTPLLLLSGSNHNSAT